MLEVLLELKLLKCDFWKPPEPPYTPQAQYDKISAHHPSQSDSVKANPRQTQCPPESESFSLSLRASSQTSRPSQTWVALTQSGSSWWWVAWCSSWASPVASERCEKTPSCLNLYVCHSQHSDKLDLFTQVEILLRFRWPRLSVESSVDVFHLQFSVFLGIIFFLELTAGVLAFVFKDWIKDQLNFFINNNIRAYRDDIDLQNLIDFTQEYVSMCFLKSAVPNPPWCWLHLGSSTPVFSSVSAFTLKWECCGAFGADDWNLNIYFNCTDSNPSREKCGVPFSCCTKDPAVSPNTNSLVIVSSYLGRMLRFCISCI